MVNIEPVLAVFENVSKCENNVQDSNVLLSYPDEIVGN
jgi:hypothetical protein